MERVRAQNVEGARQERQYNTKDTQPVTHSDDVLFHSILPKRFGGVRSIGNELESSAEADKSQYWGHLIRAGMFLLRRNSRRELL